CAVTVDDRETWVPTVRHIALEGRCFVLSACQVLRRGGPPPRPPARPVPAAPGWAIPGGGGVRRPPRRPAARPAAGGRGGGGGRPGPGRPRAGQVRLRRGRPLRPAGRVSTDRQPDADEVRCLR